MVVPVALIEQRRLALAQNAARYDELRRVHKAIAGALVDPSVPTAKALIGRALENIDTWESKGICSLFYVRAWRRIMRDPAPRIMRIVESNQGMEDAMLQNSPFGFALRDPKFNTEFESP